MVKIIEPPRQVRCGVCMALLEFSRDDVQVELGFLSVKHYLFCPCCGSKVNID